MYFISDQSIGNGGSSKNVLTASVGSVAYTYPSIWKFSYTLPLLARKSPFIEARMMKLSVIVLTSLRRPKGLSWGGGYSLNATTKLYH